MTRLLGHHPRVEVDLDPAGRPIRLRWAGTSERVEVCNEWRVEEAWWRRPIRRDYFKLLGPNLLALV
jgi:hypothetical protein